MLAYFTSGKFYETIAVVVFGLVMYALSELVDQKYLKTKSGNKKWYRSAKMITSFTRAIFAIILLFIILSINGVNVKKYVTSLGVVTVILSFALQDLLKDVIMGVSIMFEGYYKVGDCILYEGRLGKVISFNVKSTKIFMVDVESTMTISNRNISQIEVASDWFDIDVPIGYDVDLQVSRNLCRECAKRIERLRYVYSCDFLNTQSLDESSIGYKLRVHCLPEKKPPVRRNSLAVIQDVFYEHGESFPYNVLILHNGDIEQTAAKPRPEAKAVKKEVGEDGVVTERIDTTVRARKHKFDYELGRGAAKSKVCQFDGTDQSIEKAIVEAERYARSENLDNSMKLRMRLLSEELLSMTRTLPNMKNGSFQIERNDANYDICFEADAKINKSTRDNLIEVSSSNSNEAYSGLGGLLTQAIDSMMLMSVDDKKGINRVSKNTMEESIGKADDDYRWSYSIYKEKEEISNALEGRDNQVIEEEIGKSVLTRLSDDIKISVRTNHVSIRVLVKTTEED